MEPPRRRRAASALALALVAVLISTPSRAEPSARIAAQQSFDRAEQAFQAQRFAEALAAYREAAAADPSARFALTARARAADLEAHAEGDFAPLARLSAVRRDPTKSSDRAAIEALAQDVATFPPGRVRGEAALVIADAWWHHLGDPRRAVAPLEAAVADATGDPLTRSFALSELSTNAICSGVASPLMNTMTSTPPFQRTRRLSKACWIRKVDPASRSDTAEVRIAAAVSVRLRWKLAFVSRSAYMMRDSTIRTPLVTGRAR